MGLKSTTPHHSTEATALHRRSSAKRVWPYHRFTLNLRDVEARSVRSNLPSRRQEMQVSLTTIALVK